MSDTPVREYHIQDTEVIDQAVKIGAYLQKYRSNFQGKYGAVITDAWIADFEARTIRARETPTDKAMIGHQAEQTEILNAFKPRFKILHADITTASELAFADAPAVMKELGVDSLAQITYSNASFKAYIANFASFWAKHGPALVANGCPPTMGDDIAALETEFTAQRSVQGMAFDERRSATYSRIENLNEIWRKLNLLETYAKSLFGAGTATAALFGLYRGSHKAAGEDEAPVPTPPPASSPAVLPPANYGPWSTDVDSEV